VSAGAALGDYEVYVTRWLAGQYTVSATVRNSSVTGVDTYQHAIGSPIVETLVPGSLNVTNTRMINLAAPATPGTVAWQLNGTVSGRTGSNFWGVEDTWDRIPQPVTLVVATSMVLQFQAVDDFFNPVPGNSPTSTDQDYTIAVSFTPALAVDATTLAMTANPATTGQVIGGRFTYGFNPTRVGTYEMYYTISLTNVANAVVQETIGPFRVAFVPGPAAISTSIKSGSGLLSATAGVYESFAVVLNDEFGNERTSTDTVEVVMAVEEEFCIEIPDAEAEKIQSTEEAIKYIAAHPQAK
jgi:hypothetical protein